MARARVGRSLLTGIWCLSAVFASRAFADSPADLVLLHGTVLTVDARDSVAQAIAIRAGKIVRVGSDADVLPFVSSTTRGD